MACAWAKVAHVMQNPRSHRIVVLSGLAAAATSLALLAATLPLSAATIDANGLGEAQLLPFGEFKARDGRPGPGKTWKLDNEHGRAIAASLNAIARQTPLLFDYEHQTLTATEKGHKAPAAGWSREVEWRDGQGLWAKVRWTATAKGHIQAEEYLYISPVITSDADGTVTGVLMGSLVNYPALLGMEPVVAALSAFSRSTNPEPEMDRAALIALLGLAADATDVQITAAVAKLSGELPGLRAAAARALIPTALATALGVAATADEAAALSAVTQLKASSGDNGAAATAIAALQGQLAELTTRLNVDEVTQLVDKAIADKRCLPAVRDFLLGMGKKDIAQLKAFIAAAPVIEGLSGQSGGQERGGGATALTGQGAEVMRNFGLTEAQWTAAAPKH